ncbi:hypothetical protein WA158_007854 [Blastocystis sp. Blastoise]
MLKDSTLIYKYHSKKCDSTIIYFPGDIQDDDKNMTLFSGLYRYHKFSYQNTITLLHHKFPNSNILLIAPGQKNGPFSLYNNLFDCDDHGYIKDYNRNGNSCQIIHKLLSVTQDPDEFQLPYILMGFSRGTLVLNQLLTEIGYSRESMAFFENVYSIHYLDGGNRIPNYPEFKMDEINLKALKIISDINDLRVYFHCTPFFQGYSNIDDVSSHYPTFASSTEILDYVIRNRKERLNFIGQLNYYGIRTETFFYEQEYDHVSGDDLYKHMSVLDYFNELASF